MRSIGSAKRLAPIIFPVAFAFLSAVSFAQTQEVGQGRIWLAPKADAAVRPKPAEFRAGAMVERAVTTNTWYSSLAYGRWSGVLHAHPLSFQATENGLEMGVPSKELGPISKLKDWAGPTKDTAVVLHRHRADLTVSPVEFQPQDARLASAGDWNVGIEMAQGADALRATILHGSPYAYFRISHGSVRIRTGGPAKAVSGPPGPEGPAAKVIQILEVAGQHYAVYAPPGSRFEWRNDRECILHLASTADYFAIAALPDLQDSTHRLLAKHAFAFVENTRTEWRYDEAKSEVVTTYKTIAKAMDGGESEPLVGLYLHQQKVLSHPDSMLPQSLPSIRGPIRWRAGAQFETRLAFHGLLPVWPRVSEPAADEQIRSLLVGDRRRAPGLFSKMGTGTYWTGKGLGAASQLMGIAEQIGDTEAATELETLIKRRFATWFSGTAPSHFALDKKIGTVIGYPEEYGSIAALNDHHFHYGYWIMAAAHLARRDPQWASPGQMGGMVDLLVRDIATMERGRADFPFLRNFDPYEGHSWAGGDGEFFGHGNNQESSSEAINAWAGIALWGSQTGNKALRDLGIYLYATEVSSLMQYWFDADDRVLDKEYGKPLASMVFGGAYAYSTWWTEEPRQITGINWLPITPASSYLAQLPPHKVLDTVAFADQARKDYDRSGQSDGTSSDIWQDIVASVLALSDPAAALARWLPRGSVELGETRTHTLHWLKALKEMGPPDLSVRADTPHYGVFRQVGGARTYVAYNPNNEVRTVRFSDGTSLEVPQRQIAKLTRPVPRNAGS